MPELDWHFTAKLWVYSGAGAWHFVTLPVDVAEQIKFYREQRRGFGSIRVQVTIGSTQWQTSIFPDKASNSFVLPIKSAVRKQEALVVGQEVAVKIILSL